MAETNGESGACGVEKRKREGKKNKQDRRMDNAHARTRRGGGCGRQEGSAANREAATGLSQRGAYVIAGHAGGAAFVGYPSSSSLSSSLSPPSVRAYLARSIFRPEFFRRPPPPFFPLAFLSPPPRLIALFTPLLLLLLCDSRMRESIPWRRERERKRENGCRNERGRKRIALIFLFSFSQILDRVKFNW